jgi:hypothetical protein
MESNHHLWKCAYATNFLYNAARRLAFEINTFLSSIRPSKSDDITSYLNSLELFAPKSYLSGKPLRTNHPIFLMFNQLLPCCLINIFKRYKVGIKSAKPVLFHALAEFYKYLDTNIWKVRNEHFKIYKSLHGINKSSFKDYHKNFPVTRSQTSTRRQPGNNHQQASNLNKLIDLLINRNVQDPQEQWIIWTSSNFLHNGPMEAAISSLAPNQDSTSPLPGL